ncbi:MAG: hypothetical protein Q9225_005392 [Loekoesia sp. 1 TL-2023]
MAEKRNLHPSQGSSSDASHTYFTPSETLPSPSGTMLDISQPITSTYSGGFDDFSRELVSSGGECPMDVAFDLLPGIIDYPSGGEAGTLSVEQYQYRSATTDDEQAGAPYQQPSSILDDGNVATHLVPTSTNDGISNNETCYHDQNQRMYDQLAAFDQAYRHIPVSEHSIPTTTLADDIPRYIPGAIDVLAGPWSPWIASTQVDGVRLVSELIYEPAIDVGATDPDVQGSGFHESFVEEVDPDWPMEENLRFREPAFPKDNIDPPPPPDPVGPPPDIAYGKERHSLKNPNGNVIGGRRHGPLNAQSRQNAKTARQKGQCWNSSLAEQHELEKLRAFASKRVYRWLDNHMTVYLTWGYFRSIKCDVTEIESNGPSLLHQNQYRLDLMTNQYDLVHVPSPPLGMVLMFVSEWRSKLNMYLEELLQTSFRRFPEVCFRGNACRVERDFLLPIFEYHEATTGKAQELVHQSLKLVVVSHIMTHSMTLIESSKDTIYDRLRNPPSERYGHQTSPRWLNKQFKFLFSALHQDVLRDVLGQIQGTLRHAGGKAVWAALFAGMVILAMTTGSMQVAVRGKEETDKGEDMIRQDDTTADEAIKLMDERFESLKSLFRQKYNRLNPVQKPRHRALLDDASQSLAAKASEIIENHYDFLIARQVLPPPSKASEPQTARLIAQFLLCFAPPAEQHCHQPAVPASSE